MQDVDVDDDAALALWVDKLSDMVERQQATLQQEAARCKVAGIILRALHASVRGVHKRVCDTETTCRLLVATKVMMRDRRGIQSLLTMEALELFLSLAESPDVAVGEEALKCVINSVYSRPEFVRDHALPHGYAQRALKITTRAAPASFHFMAWKALLVACEANEMITTLVYDITTWQQIHATLHFSLRGGGSTLPFPSGLDRANLFLELVKLIAVLVNDLKLSNREHAQRLDPNELVATLQPLGDLLLETLRYSPPHMSPFTPELIDLKNKVMEIFMFIPTELLGFFVQQQHEALTTILGHLHTMLVLVRIEKTRMPKDLQPVLVACHHLTSTGDPGIKRFFTAHVFPPPADAPTQTAPSKPAPPAFFHKHLTFFLTSLDTTIKRYMGEWLYLLCDQNADEYTRRTGIGNAIGLLRIKGLA